MSEIEGTWNVLKDIVRLLKSIRRAPKKDDGSLSPIGKAAKQDLPASSSSVSQYLIPEEDADLLTWVQSVLRLEGFKFLARTYDSPPRYVIGSSEQKKGFQVGFDILYGKTYKVGTCPDFLNPSWYNGSEAYEIFLKYGLIELWVESATGNFYALTPKCEELILRVRRLAQSKAEDINNPPQDSPLNLN